MRRVLVVLSIALVALAAPGLAEDKVAAVTEQQTQASEQQSQQAQTTEQQTEQKATASAPKTVALKLTPSLQADFTVDLKNGEAVLTLAGGYSLVAEGQDLLSDVLTAALAGAINAIVAPIDGKEVLPGVKLEAGVEIPTVTAELAEDCGVKLTATVLNIEVPKLDLDREWSETVEDPVKACISVALRLLHTAEEPFIKATLDLLTGALKVVVHLFELEVSPSEDYEGPYLELTPVNVSEELIDNATVTAYLGASLSASTLKLSPTITYETTTPLKLPVTLPEITLCTFQLPA
ncbi:hypothetical protein [Methanopyrus sp. SNP6]|uniref:hypothetical protein n=1 Tax=Methanopyrus sp. SNP6 TaxID=1937005 RepID=UPI0011E58CD6|nr:hypothetical protein [Methanopyrus sp. SNP6]